MDRGTALVKNTLLLSIGQFVPKVVAMLTLPILTRYLHEREYGVYELANSMISLILPLMTLQIQQIAFRYLVVSKEKEDKVRYFTSTIIFVFMSSLIFFPLVYIYLAKFTIYNYGESLLICVFLLAESLYHLTGYLVRGLGYNLKYSIGVIVFSIFQVTLMIVLLIILKTGVVGAFLTFAASYVAAVIYMCIGVRIWKYIDLKKYSIDTTKKMLTLSLPIVPSAVSGWIVNQSDRIIINTFLGIEATAIYAVANKIPNLFSAAYATFDLAWIETATLISEDEDPSKYYSQMLNYLIRFLVGAMLILIAFTPLMFKIFINEKFDIAYYQMPILFSGVFFSSLVAFSSAIYVAIKRTKQEGVSSALGAGLSILTNIIFIKQLGIISSSVSTVVAYFTICLYRVYDLKKVLDLKYEWKRIIIGMISFITASILCYQRTLISTILCFVIAVIYNVFENKMILKFAGKMIKKVCKLK